MQDNYNALHVAAMYSREEVVKLLLPKKGVDVYAPGGVSVYVSLFSDKTSCNAKTSAVQDCRNKNVQTGKRFSSPHLKFLCCGSIGVLL